MSGRVASAVCALLPLLAACHGGGGPSNPTTPVPTHTVFGGVFYDENGNGTLDSGENTRLPQVVVEIAGRTGRTSAVVGEFTIEGVPAGNHPIVLQRSSLPPYYAVPERPVAVSVPVPEGQSPLVPVTLPIGTNRPNVYMAFGDSITIGQGSSDDEGYRTRLRAKLLAHFGRATIVNEGVDASRSNRGADRIDESLRRVRPAFTLIHYGTNDWNAGECKASPPCFTIDSLRDMIRAARTFQSMPVLSTIVPSNPASVQQPDRNDWVRGQNERIRALARAEQVPLADPFELFMRDSDPERLFVDHVHPGDPGYELMAQAFFTAITTPPSASASSLAAPGSDVGRPARPKAPVDKVRVRGKPAA